jgi:hypothetical protein
VFYEDATNDLVVPTDGTYGHIGHPAFPLPAERYIVEVVPAQPKRILKVEYSDALETVYRLSDLQQHSCER